jgi:hypothetical protein
MTTGGKAADPASPSGMSSMNTCRLDSWWIERRWRYEQITARLRQFAGQDFYVAQHYAALGLGRAAEKMWAKSDPQRSFYSGCEPMAAMLVCDLRSGCSYE